MEDIRTRVWVSEQDEWLLDAYVWHINSNGYARTALVYGKLRCYLHHAIMGVPWLYDDVIDHINRNKLDNRRENLRYATRFEQRNNSVNVIEAANIAWHRERYRVQIIRNGIRHTSAHLTMEEAIASRDAFLRQQS